MKQGLQHDERIAGERRAYAAAPKTQTLWRSEPAVAAGPVGGERQAELGAWADFVSDMHSWWF